MFKRPDEVCTPKEKDRIYVTGTGRAGTTFLIQFLTELGLDTGFRNSHDKSGDVTYFPTARAGMEWDIYDRNGPTIVKSPYLCDHIDSLLAAGFKFRHVIVPIRDIASAAASRRLVQLETTGQADGDPVAGGLWGTKVSDDQENILARKFAALVEALVRNELPMTFVNFPRITTDEHYLFDKLGPVFPEVRSKRFHEAFRATARPELVNQFPSSSREGEPG